MTSEESERKTVGVVGVAGERERGEGERKGGEGLSKAREARNGERGDEEVGRKRR